MSHIGSWQSLLAYLCRFSRNATFSSLATVSSILVVPVSDARSAEVKYTDFPFLIYCEVGDVHHAFYLSKIGPDGVAVYISQAGQAGTITLTGKPQQIGGDTAGSCEGKTLEELRSVGQAFYLQR